jgi:hypothetical protein
MPRIETTELSEILEAIKRKLIGIVTLISFSSSPLSSFLVVVEMQTLTSLPTDRLAIAIASSGLDGLFSAAVRGMLSRN